MTDYTQKRVMCGSCDNAWRIANLHLKVNRNGAESFAWVCSTCERPVKVNNVLWISPDKVVVHLTRTQLQALPHLMDPLFARCARCGSRDAEEHHWAPRAMFEDADKWPCDYLCKRCHDIWHLKVTPQLVKGAA